jgi:hypothetical protein
VVDDPNWRWPLPDTLDGPPGSGGRYVKVSESQLDPQPRGSHVIRGALYEWQPAEVAADAARLAIFRELAAVPAGQRKPITPEVAK